MIMIKCVYFALTVFGLIPVLFGLLYEMILLLPIRVPLHHTPVHLLWQVWQIHSVYTACATVYTFFSFNSSHFVAGWTPEIVFGLGSFEIFSNAYPLLFLQDWGLGVLFVKILYAGTLTGPDWHFKRVLEQVITSLVIYSPQTVCRDEDFI